MIVIDDLITKVSSDNTSFGYVIGKRGLESLDHNGVRFVDFYTF